MVLGFSFEVRYFLIISLRSFCLFALALYLYKFLIFGGVSIFSFRINTYERYMDSLKTLHKVFKA